MKSLLISASLILSVLFAFPQEKLDELISRSSEAPPDSIEAYFPHFFKAIQNTLSSDKYLSKVYYGSFDSKKVIYGSFLKSGYLFIDKSMLTSKSGFIDNISTWDFFISVGSIHSYRDNPEEAKYNTYLNRYSFAIEKATTIAIADNYCAALRMGIKGIESISGKKDDEMKQAAIDVQTEKVYLNAKDVLAKCSPSNNNKMDVGNTPVTEKIKEPEPIKEKPVSIQVNAGRIAAAMENIRLQKDEFSDKIIYYSKKTPKTTIDDDRLYIFLVEEKSGEKILHACIRHNADINIREYLFIEKFIIKTDKQNYPFDDISKFVLANGTQHSCFNATFRKGIKMYEILTDLMNSEESKVRLIGYGRQLDFTVSSREKKAIKDVLELYEAMNSN